MSILMARPPIQWNQIIRRISGGSLVKSGDVRWPSSSICGSSDEVFSCGRINENKVYRSSIAGILSLCF